MFANLIQSLAKVLTKHENISVFSRYNCNFHWTLLLLNARDQHNGVDNCKMNVKHGFMLNIQSN